MKYRANSQDTWHNIKVKALDSMPIGAGLEFYGQKSQIPNGFLICDGSAVSRTTYSDLFALIGTTYGTGDGSTTFNLPNLNGRVSVGINENDSDFDTLGETGGSKEMQKHNHKLRFNDGGGAGAGGYITTSSSYNYSETQTLDAGTGNSGNLQPYIAVWKCIKAFNTTPTMASVFNTHSNSTTDTYSCDYINNSDSYSTSEIKTNKRWIDGKPIYRKVISDTTSSSSEQTMLSAISNLDYCISINGILVDSGYSLVIPSYVNSNNYTNCAMTNDKRPYLAVSSGYRGKPFTLIVEYTKTTD